MDALESALLFDYYGGMLTEKQRQVCDMRFNQDLSLGEIAETLGVSRQAVSDNLTRTENLLRKMEDNIGSMKRGLAIRKALAQIISVASPLASSPDPAVAGAAERIMTLASSIEE